MVLAGFSMGGAVVTSFLLSLAPGVPGPRGGARLPALNLGEVIDRGAADRGCRCSGPRCRRRSRWPPRAFAGVRYDLDWGQLDYVDRAGGLAAPVLVFHQTGDPTVPVAISEALAAARPDLVTLERFAGDSRQSWNVTGPATSGRRPSWTGWRRRRPPDHGQRQGAG